MPRLTRRDLTVLIMFAVLVAAIVTFALLDLTRWALIGIGVLVGAAAMLTHAQFAVRRQTFEMLRRASRQSRRSSTKIERLGAAGLERADALEASVLRARDTVRADARKVQDAVRADAAVMQSGVAAISDAATRAREDVAAVLLEMASLRAELRGVRVAQQLFSRSIAQSQNQVASVAQQVAQMTASQGAAQSADLTAHNKSAVVASDAASSVNLAGTAVADQVAKQLQPTIRSLEWQIRRQRADLISDFQAMEQLLDRLSTDAPLPPVAGWALGPAGLLMLTDKIIKHGAELVVECGSGSSTLWMALAMREMGRGKVIALEHLPEYAERTQELLNAHEVAPWAEVRIAPLTSVATPQGEFLWYDTARMSWDGPIDMLLVDGPPTTTGTHARYPALTVLGNRLRPGATIVIDDTDRQDEREVISIWEQEHPQLVQRTSPGPGIEVYSFG